MGIALLVLAAIAALALVPAAIGEEASGPAVPDATVTVVADGEQIRVATTATTVAQALRDAGVVLGELDRTEPTLSAPLPADSIIRVTRVETEVLTEEIVEPKQVTVLANEGLRQGLVLKLKEGVDGRVRRTVRVWRKDGVETTRDVLESKVVARRVDAVELHGSSTSPSRSGGVRTALTMSASAYDPGPRSCGKYASGYTATGMRAGKGVVAVDPRVIPLGSKLYIEGYGLAIAGDTGGAIKGLRIDLGYDSYAEAIRFGRRTVKVYVLE